MYTKLGGLDKYFFYRKYMANNTEIYFEISSNLLISNGIRNSYMHFRSKQT